MRYSLFWREEDQMDRYLMFVDEEYDGICDDTLNNFSVALGAIIPEMEIKEDLLACYNSSSSKSFRPNDPEGKTDPEWLTTYGFSRDDNQGHEPFVKSIMIPKCPGETRDGVTVTPESKRLLTRVGKAISQLMKNSKYKTCVPSCMDSDGLDKKLQGLTDKYSYYLCQDFSKMGLSLPKRVILAVLQACYDATLYEPFLEAKDFFSRVKVYTDDFYRDSVRGYCLGLFNEGASLVQLALHYLNLEEIHEDLDGMFLNDDSVVGFHDLDVAVRYACVDTTIASV
jgi:hypothetical protein